MVKYKRPVPILCLDPNLFQALGAVAQATAAIGTFVWVSAGAAAANPAPIIEAVAATPAAVCVTAAVGAATAKTTPGT